MIDGKLTVDETKVIDVNGSQEKVLCDCGIEYSLAAEILLQCISTERNECKVTPGGDIEFLHRS